MTAEFQGIPVKQASVFNAILVERRRQDEDWPDDNCANREVPIGDKLAVLTEEVGEVARAINEDRLRRTRVPVGVGTPGEREAYLEDCDNTLRHELKAELTQVVAVGVAWLESLG